MGSGIKLIILFVSLLISGCQDEPWNDPYPYESPDANTYFSFFTERPKHLDPARSYTAAEWPIIGQIYEPPLQYHYFKRPYELQPLTATEIPTILFYDADGKLMPENTPFDKVSYTEYTITIKPNIYYSPHPAFAKNERGEYRYLNLTEAEINQYEVISDFKETGTRELIAEDYVYQIKRLAEPSLSSPLYGLMSGYIEGLAELRAHLMKTASHMTEQDLRSYALSGATVIDRHTYRLRIKGKSPHFHYWLTTPFFSPVPWEAALFYAQPGLTKNNISLDWYPVGTGAYQLTQNNPERRMVLIRNPLFRGEFYPSEISSEDETKGFLALKGEKIPFIDKIIFTLEKEDISHWNKFLQGYYDASAITADNFRTAIRFNKQGHPELTPLLKERGIHLNTGDTPDIFYWGINMLDETLGGFSERALKIREALSLAFDVQAFISLFLNGRGEVATGPLPPDIFGYDLEPKAPLFSQQDKDNNLIKAKALLKEAGVEHLTLYFDTVVSGQPDEIGIHTWMKEQFNKLGIELIIRGSDFNRFQDKLKSGSAQLFFIGWLADYPDPDNFLFLLYGPNSSARVGGENNSNYSNPQYDKLFEQMKSLQDGEERKAIIKEMLTLVDHDKPWFAAFYPKAYGLYHAWVSPLKQSRVLLNSLKYVKLNPTLRAKSRSTWNNPKIWPIWGGLLILLLGLIPAIIHYWRTLNQSKERL